MKTYIHNLYSDKYLRFKSGVTYRCFPIYKTGGADVSVDIEVTT